MLKGMFCYIASYTYIKDINNIITKRILKGMFCHIALYTYIDIYILHTYIGHNYSLVHEQ